MEVSADQTSSQLPGLWPLLGLPEADLEQYDFVAANLTVACGIHGLESLDIAKYVRTVDEWTDAFRRSLPSRERMFYATPEKWKHDIHLFRVVMLMGYLAVELGIRYNDEQDAYQRAGGKEVWYTDPGDLFLHGVIDTKQGTCANMSALHVAIARRLGWPVTLATVWGHQISRFDNGNVYHNIEATGIKQGCVVSDPDAEYIKRHKLPQKAIDCGSDLQKLTMRQMMGLFMLLRGRHYGDTQRETLADMDYALARVLFPQHRRTYVAAMMPAIHHGARLFEKYEMGHPNTLFHELSMEYGVGEMGRWPSALPGTILNMPRAIGRPDIYVSSLPKPAQAIQ